MGANGSRWDDGSSSGSMGLAVDLTSSASEPADGSDTEQTASSSTTARVEAFPTGAQRQSRGLQRGGAGNTSTTSETASSHSERRASAPTAFSPSPNNPQHIGMAWDNHGGVGSQSVPVRGRERSYNPDHTLETNANGMHMAPSPGSVGESERYTVDDEHSTSTGMSGGALKSLRSMRGASFFGKAKKAATKATSRLRLPLEMEHAPSFRKPTVGGGYPSRQRQPRRRGEGESQSRSQPSGDSGQTGGTEDGEGGVIAYNAITAQEKQTRTPTSSQRRGVLGIRPVGGHREEKNSAKPRRGTAPAGKELQLSANYSDMATLRASRPPSPGNFDLCSFQSRGSDRLNTLGDAHYGSWQHDPNVIVVRNGYQSTAEAQRDTAVGDRPGSANGLRGSAELLDVERSGSGLLGSNGVLHGFFFPSPDDDVKRSSDTSDVPPLLTSRGSASSTSKTGDDTSSRGSQQSNDNTSRGSDGPRTPPRQRGHQRQRDDDATSLDTVSNDSDGRRSPPTIRAASSDDDYDRSTSTKLSLEEERRRKAAADEAERLERLARLKRAAEQAAKEKAEREAKEDAEAAARRQAAIATAASTPVPRPPPPPPTAVPRPPSTNTMRRLSGSSSYETMPAVAPRATPPQQQQQWPLPPTTPQQWSGRPPSRQWPTTPQQWPPQSQYMQLPQHQWPMYPGQAMPYLPSLTAETEEGGDALIEAPQVVRGVAGDKEKLEWSFSRHPSQIRGMRRRSVSFHLQDGK